MRGAAHPQLLQARPDGGALPAGGMCRSSTATQQQPPSVLTGLRLHIAYGWPWPMVRRRPVVFAWTPVTYLPLASLSRSRPWRR